MNIPPKGLNENLRVEEIEGHRGIRFCTVSGEVVLSLNPKELIKLVEFLEDIVLS